MGSQRLDALLSAARLAAEDPDPEVGDGTGGDVGGGLRRLEGGASHDVFAAYVDRRPAVIKVFRLDRPGRADRELEALQRLSGTAIAPEPIWFESDTAERPVLVMSHLRGEARRADELDARAIAQMVQAHRDVNSSLPQSGYVRNATNNLAVVVDQARALTARLTASWPRRLSPWPRRVSGCGPAKRAVCRPAPLACSAVATSI